jgi:hypothetical protein
MSAASAPVIALADGESAHGQGQSEGTDGDETGNADIGFHGEMVLGLVIGFLCLPFP